MLYNTQKAEKSYYFKYRDTVVLGEEWTTSVHSFGKIEGSSLAANSYYSNEGLRRARKKETNLETKIEGSPAKRTTIDALNERP